MEFLTDVSLCVGSPDQCSCWGTTIAPFAGKFYLGIHEWNYANSGEAISIKLSAPLVAGKSYTFPLMAAIAPITAWGGGNGDRDGVIYVYGGTATCAKTQLIDSITLFTPADRNKWRQFTFNFSATQNHTHVSFFTRRKIGTVLTSSYMVLDDAILNDCGDAPDTYKTLLKSDGARHRLTGTVPDPVIGMTADYEEDGLPGATVNGDDNNGSPDDEDGFTILPDLSLSQTQYSLNNIPVKNATGKTAWLAGWIDFNINGVFEATEVAVTAVPSGGPQNASLNWSGFTIPSIGATYARFRISTDTNILNQTALLCRSFGLAADGEVEDHKIKITNCASVSVSPDVSICNGVSTNLQANGSASYSWSPSLGLSCANCPNPVASPAVTTTYTVTGSSGSCPPSTAKVTVNVIQAPKAVVSPDDTICLGAQTILTASGGDQYSWSPATGLSQSSGSSVTANPSGTITYSVSALRTGCPPSTATVTITVISAGKPDAGPDASICPGESVVLKGSSNGSYKWSPSAGLSCTNCLNPVANPTVTTTYTLTSIIGDCPSASDAVMVTLLDQPSGSAGPSQSVTQGQPIKLIAEGGIAYRWLSDNSTNAMLEVIPMNDTVFCVEVTGANGCSDTACTTVSVTEPIFSTLWIPKSFTPNEDRINTIFKTPGINIIEYHAFIFNRWGEMIYEWSDIEKGWDGTFQGVPVQDDIYAFKVKALGIDGVKYDKTGMIVLIK